MPLVSRVMQMEPPPMLIDEETIDLKDIFTIIKKHIFTIIVCMFVGLGLAGGLTFFVLTPKYSSQAQLVVTLPQNQNTNTNDVNVNLQMINTYKNLIKGDLILNKVKDQLKENYGINMTVQEIDDAIDVVQSENSLMFSLVAYFDETNVSKQEPGLTRPPPSAPPSGPVSAPPRESR